MHTRLLTFCLLSTFALAEPVAIDWERAKALHQRVSNGETLSAENQKYYDEAKRQRGGGEANPEMRRAQEIHQRKQAGGTISPEDDKFLAEAMRKHAGGNRPPAASGQPVASAEVIQALVPLTELKAGYHGQDGGLYGGGSNEPPAPLAARAKNAAAQIQPLGADGKPASDGKIVLVSLGMSNTTQEFSAFKRLADADARKAGNVAIVDCAQGGRTAQAWATSDQPWEEAVRRIEAAGFTPAQVQVLWLKQANAGPSGGFPAAADKLRDDIRTDLQRAREKYPNLRVVFLSSRIYAGYATGGLNPEPYAYESGFAMREVIRTQPADGPALLWGPYLWTAGEKGRALDDLKWTREDCAADGTHPSPAGQAKIAQLLLRFFTSDPHAAPWFVRR